MPTFLRVTMAKIRAALGAARHERDFDEELAAHLEMATADKIRQGLAPREARRRARVELGNLTLLREAGREARGLPWIGTTWLDVKLGLRMLRKSWGLTLVAGLALTVVFGLAAVAFDVLAAFAGTDLPLAEGDRVVVLESWDRQASRAVPSTEEDFARWRRELRSLDDLGAFRTVERNLEVAAGGETGRPVEAIAVAEITASGFALARVAPSLGRTLLPEDEAAGADPVLVIGHRAWQTDFAADPAILGRRVRLDGTVHTIVGVMPADFAFPVAHRYWTPLRTAGADDGAGEAAAAETDDLTVFARLGLGTSLADAGAELRRVGRLADAAAVADAVADRPEVELRVVPYATAFIGEIPPWVASLVVVFASLLLVPPAVNVAILVYARTVARREEFAARHALGARRFDIVAQLFVEILVLATVAGVVALGAARLVLWQVREDLRARGDGVPFWVDFASSPRTLVFVGGLAVGAALIAGALPALQATGRRLQTGLRGLSGQSRPQLGGVWTTLIVVQAGLSFALLPTAVEMTWGTLRTGLLGPGFAAEEYLTARLEQGGADAAAGEDTAARFADRRGELVRSLVAEPGIAGVTVAAAVPGEEPWLRIETEQGAPAVESGSLAVGSHRVARVNHVDARFFAVFELPVLTGRGFGGADFAGGTNAVVVNRAFVDEVLGGADPLGRRVRYRTLDAAAAAAETRPDRWLEIVGVVADLERHASSQTLYHPAYHTASAPAASAPAATRPSVGLAMRVHGDPVAAAARLRELAWAVDPTLHLTRVRRLDEIYRQKAVGNYLGGAALVAATVSVLLLSAAGIYALLAFTVERRRREVGIRAALGARPRHLVAGIFGRALAQVGLGALAGIGVALLVGHYLPVARMGGREVPGVIPAAAAFVVAVALLALVGPARRALRIAPIEELRQG